MPPLQVYLPQPLYDQVKARDLPVSEVLQKALAAAGASTFLPKGSALAVKRYFKHEAESELGAGTAYVEISNDWPSRQVEVYGQTWRWGDEAHPEHLADQPLDVLELGEEPEISSEEFERVWTEALRRCRPDS